MEQYYSNDSLTAYKTEDGIYIEERKKGSLKMMLVIIGFSLLIVLASFIMGIFGGGILKTMAPFLFWGGAIILAVGILAFVIKMTIQGDPKITFDTNKNELSVRGKIIPFAIIDSIVPNAQQMMGKTMTVAFIMIANKKKSLFSVAIVVPQPKEMEDFILSLNEVVQNGKAT